MRVDRRTFGSLAGGVVLGVLSGCGKKPDGAGLELMAWLRQLDGVDHVEVAGSDDRYPLMSLAEQRSDEDVTALIAKIRKEFKRRQTDEYSRIELDIDDFRAQFYLSQPGEDLDVARILWLRRDGRATASRYGPSGLIVTAPPAAVAAVAVGLDQVVPSENGRRTHRVESIEREVVVQWTDCPSLGFRLDRAATQHFADLQRRYPGLTGWVEAPDRRAGVYFAAGDIGLDALLTALPTLATGLFGRLELGWGPARAAAADFAEAFTPPVRRLTAELMKIPGVTRIALVADGPRRITVRNRAGYVAAVASLRKVWDSYLAIDLIRRRSRFIGRLGNEVFTGSRSDTGTQYQIHVAVADIIGVTGVQVGEDVATLSIAHDITDQDLAAALEAMTVLASTHRIDMYLNRDLDSVAVAVLGQIRNRSYFPPSPAPADLDPALITRVTNTWTRVKPR